MGSGRGNRAGSGGKISAAVQTQHSITTRPVNVPQGDYGEMALIEVEGGDIPLEIQFKSTADRIKLKHTHSGGGAGQTEETSSEEEPHRIFHTARIPIIAEIREIVQPIRRVFQGEFLPEMLLNPQFINPFYR